MGKDLKGKELGLGLSQEKSGVYVARFTNRFGKRQIKRCRTLRECRQWMAKEKHEDDGNNINMPENFLLDAWYNYWIDKNYLAEHA